MCIVKIDCASLASNSNSRHGRELAKRDKSQSIFSCRVRVFAITLPNYLATGRLCQFTPLEKATGFRRCYNATVLHTVSECSSLTGFALHDEG